MLRLLTVLAPLGLLFCLTPAAPVPKGAHRPSLYFPTRAGDRLVYCWENGTECVVTVTAVEEEAGGAKRVSVGHEWMGGVEPWYTLLVSERGVAHVYAYRRDDSPLWDLRLPAKVGECWVWPESSPPEQQCTSTTRGVERVTVPAGEFAAVLVVTEWMYEGKRLTESAWYAAGVGEVKRVNGASVRTLTSFTPGDGSPVSVSEPKMRIRSGPFVMPRESTPIDDARLKAAAAKLRAALERARK